MCIRDSALVEQLGGVAAVCRSVEEAEQALELALAPWPATDPARQGC